ncbi:MAG: CTP synthase, partial [Rivularia sp. ALOHA_DT_140]|nr:CTP synthase [Rivularia sp. ALOHA_DT_140]
TVGDIEGLPFFEAIRQLNNEMPRLSSIFVHLTLVPFILSAGELKTKPTQHSVKELRSIGIQPDILLCRCDRTIPEAERNKIALFCNVQKSAIIQALDAPSIYEVPLSYHAQGLDHEVLRAFGITEAREPNLTKWYNISKALSSAEGEVTIAIVGKYALRDAYKSLNEALVHGGLANSTRIKLNWVDAETLEQDKQRFHLKRSNAIIVPGAFGERGAEGKISAIKFAREHGVPYLGICYGMQMACIEVARNLAGISDASSMEFGFTEEPVIGLMKEWGCESKLERRDIVGELGGTMRLGSYTAILSKDSRISSIYGSTLISERHRHRYEVNMAYREKLENVGLKISGVSLDGQLPEIIEYAKHPWFIGVQFHPELKSRPFDPHPLFSSFIAAAIRHSHGYLSNNK